MGGHRLERWRFLLFLLTPVGSVYLFHIPAVHEPVFKHLRYVVLPVREDPRDRRDREIEAALAAAEAAEEAEKEARRLAEEDKDEDAKWEQERVERLRVARELAARSAKSAEQLA